MSQVQRLLEVLHKHPHAELRIVEDAPIVLRDGGHDHPLTKAPLTRDAWRALVAQVYPVAALGEVPGTPESRVQWNAGEARYVTTITRDEERSAAVITFGNTEAAAAGSPIEVVPEAPPAAEAFAMVETLLKRQSEMGASDLHVRSNAVPLLRNAGEMERQEDLGELSADMVHAMLASIMPERNRKEFAEHRDSDFAYEIVGYGRFRINALYDRFGPALVARAIPDKLVTAEELNISPEVKALCQLTKGLVLVTGPTGSGKSTTLCALVDLVNRTRRDHVITIEDPIEFVHESKGCLITQRQVGVHTGSFRNALRAALREDPDVVLVGELRDLETMAIAIETAETGHLVFGTLHTSTAASTVDRIIDQFPPDRQEQVRVMLSESLRGVISQTLCRKKGGGRVAAMEVLLVTPAVSNLIREGKTFQMTSIMQTSRKLGMITMNDALLGLVEKDLIEPKEAYLKAVDKSGIVASLKSKGYDVSFAEIDPAATPPRGEAVPGKPGSSGARPGAPLRR